MMLALALAVQEPAPTRPFRELCADYAERMESVAGLEGEGRLVRVPRGAGEVATASFHVTVWLRDSEETPRAVRAVERDDVGEVFMFVTAAEATQIYRDEGLAYVFDLARARNTPWSWYFLVGPTDELRERFDVEVLRSPGAESEGEGPCEHAPEVVAQDAVSTGHEATAFLSDPYREDAWILSLVPRDRALRDELRTMTVWLEKDSLLPYRFEVSTASEDLTVQLSPFREIAEYPREAFQVDLDGLEVRRR